LSHEDAQAKFTRSSQISIIPLLKSPKVDKLKNLTKEKKRDGHNLDD